jgi:hypothetical protein
VKTKVAIGDVVVIHGLRIGKVIHKFSSATGEEVFDVELTGSGRHVAALKNHIIANLGPDGGPPGTGRH